MDMKLHDTVWDYIVLYPEWNLFQSIIYRVAF